MRIENRAKSARITGLNCPAQGFTFAQFFANSFVNQHVRIDGHADGQHQPGDARQRERRSHRAHHAQQNNDIREQRDIRHHSRHHVIDQHEYRDCKCPVNRRFHTAANRIRAQRRADLPQRLDLQRRSQRILQNVLQLERFLLIKISSDLPAPVDDRFVNVGRGI